MRRVAETPAHRISVACRAFGFELGKSGFELVRHVVERIPETKGTRLGCEPGTCSESLPRAIP